MLEMMAHTTEDHKALRECRHYEWNELSLHLHVLPAPPHVVVGRACPFSVRKPVENGH